MEAESGLLWGRATASLRSSGSPTTPQMQGVGVCVCVCVVERERYKIVFVCERDGERGKEYVLVLICVSIVASICTLP